MQLSEVIIAPLLTEKSNILSEKFNVYAFKVHKKSNKIEVKKAVENLYNVHVLEVNTMILPSKNKARLTKKGLFKGRKPSYKKAVVKLPEGEKIDVYAE